MRWGFVLDQESCIGCHACTVACKQENDVPLGSFRTWVKWIEHGEFPDTKRSAAVLRCNHCEDAPCVEICPTVALHKRPDGIVDLDASRCIGCASCIQACPYDAIYIDDRVGTAAKCHFCAHRMEVNLAPACVAVCPVQAIWVVDYDDPALRKELDERRAAPRKPERATKPQTFYLGAHPATLDPLAVDGTRTLSHAEVPDPMPGPGIAAARAVYDVPRARRWGWRITAYMVAKAGASGALLAAALGLGRPRVLGAASLGLLAVTLVFLVADLHKPQRFLFLLTKGNPRSWLVRGAYVLMAHGAFSVPYLFGLAHPALSVFAALSALLTSVYTAFLFRQARGRELWCEDRLLPFHLALQAAAAACAFGWFWGAWRVTVVAAYACLSVLGAVLGPSTKQGRRAHALMVKHPAFRLGLVVAASAILFPPAVFLAFALLDWALVKAGQEVPLS
ncbi:MAG: 4Fe-4S dicluster domain-containing protein [Planctomycetaceae bacterium]